MWRSLLHPLFSWLARHSSSLSQWLLSLTPRKQNINKKMIEKISRGYLLHTLSPTRPGTRGRSSFPMAGQCCPDQGSQSRPHTPGDSHSGLAQRLGVKMINCNFEGSSFHPGRWRKTTYFLSGSLDLR